MKKRIYSLLEQLQVIEGVHIHLSEFNSGMLPINVLTGKPYTHKDNFVTYYFSYGEATLFGTEMITDVEVSVNVYGEGSNQLANQLRAKMGQSSTIKYLESKKMRCINQMPTMVDLHEIINEIWYERKNLTFTLQISEKVEIVKEEMARIGDLNIKEV